MRKSWTDERLDDFRTDVNRRFDDIDRRFDEVKGEMNRRFGEVDRRIDELDRRVERRFDKVDTELHRVVIRLDSLTKAIIYSTVTLSGSMIAGFVAIAFAAS